METENTSGTKAEGSAAMDCEIDTSAEFKKVKSKKNNKRKLKDSDMESEDTVARKRPEFPPISGDKLKVDWYYHQTCLLIITLSFLEYTCAMGCSVCCVMLIGP